MNNKMLFIMCILCVILVGCSKNIKVDTNIEIGIIGNDYPIDRATVSKMMALASYSKPNIVSLDNIINFNDVSKDDWYNKYINCVYIKGDMSGVLEDEFDPMGNLTITQTQYLINKYDKNKKIKMDDKNKDKPISYALWCNIYSQIVQDENIKQEELVILATKDTNNSLKEDYAITDKGIYSFEGIEINKYINTKVKVIKRDNEVIAITEVLEIEPILNRCYIEKVSNNFVDIFIGGARKRLYLKNDNTDIKENETLADIKINRDNEILSIDYYYQTTKGVINRLDDNTIRLNNTNYVLDENFKVYSKIDGKMALSNKENLLIGQNIATFFTKGNENKIYGAIIDDKPIYEQIRVAINDSSYNNLFFNEIKLNATNGLKIFVKGNEKSLQSLHIKSNQDFNIGENEIIIIEPNNKDEGMIFKNLKRGYEEPIFYGKLEITKINNKYVIINQLDIEKYIESVLASNRNDYKNLEMLKTLAIIYRSTAINYIEENALINIGANLDDSSKYQIYNNIKIEDIDKQAVQQTNGKILISEDKVIKPTYFSYSGGITANSGEIWPDKYYHTYPTENKLYLQHIKDYEGIYENLQDEVNANIFYKTKDINSIENDSKWFRWTTTLDENDINKINQNIKNIYKNERFLIKTLENGKFIYKQIDDIGKIKDINVKSRGEAGNIMELEIIGDKNTILLKTDSVIKKSFTLKNIIDNNGNLENIITLPSSYFVFDKIYDNNGYLKKLTFYGGGYGHGVGLSMYGANKMAEEGKTFDEILTKYYTDTNIIDTK